MNANPSNKRYRTCFSGSLQCTATDPCVACITKIQQHVLPRIAARMGLNTQPQFKALWDAWVEAHLALRTAMISGALAPEVQALDLDLVKVQTAAEHAAAPGGPMGSSEAFVPPRPEQLLAAIHAGMIDPATVPPQLLAAIGYVPQGAPQARAPQGPMPQDPHRVVLGSVMFGVGVPMPFEAPMTSTPPPQKVIDVTLLEPSAAPSAAPVEETVFTTAPSGFTTAPTSPSSIRQEVAAEAQKHERRASQQTQHVEAELSADDLFGAATPAHEVPIVNHVNGSRKPG